MKWEYNVMVFDPKFDPWELEEELKKVGKDGWELVSADETRFIFKRPIQGRERGRLGNV